MFTDSSSASQSDSHGARDDSHMGKADTIKSGYGQMNTIFDGYDDGNVDDGFLSKELIKLSMVDRNLILEEIHGVRCLAIKETPQLIKRSLQEFQRELDSNNISESKKKIYLRIREIREQVEFSPPSSSDIDYETNANSNEQGYHRDYNHNYAIDDNDFRLRFLRCELFNVQKAALRFCNYLDYVYEHWGDVALLRPIRLTDFSKTEMKVFRKGLFQLLPFRDSSGRRIMVYLGGTRPYEDARAMNKMCFYLWDVATRDSIDSQQKGIVIVRLHGNVSKDESGNQSDGIARNKNFIDMYHVTDNINKTLLSIPSRIVAIHARIPNHLDFRLVRKLFVTQILSGNNACLRPRFILGSGGTDMETRRKLKTYGIPSLLFPLTDTNSIKCIYHNQWIRTRKILEQKEFGKPNHDDGVFQACEDIINSNSLVECPALNDVVFRKGSRVTSIENPGNRFFRDLIRTFLEEKERETEKLREAELSNTTPSFECEEQLAHENEDDAVQQAFGPSRKNTGKGFCDWIVDHIEQNCKGRFLEWNTGISGWVVMRERSKITRKISITLYNWGKKLQAKTVAAKKQKRSNPPVSPLSIDTGDSPAPMENIIYCNDVVSSSIGNGNGKKNGGTDENRDANYFFDAQKSPSRQEGRQCISSSPWDDTSAWVTPTTPTSAKKRSRTDSLLPVNRPFAF